MATLGTLVESVIGDLRQFNTSPETTGTFVDWERNDALAIVGVQLADISSDLNNARIELATGEQVHVSSYAVTGATAICPPWFRAQNGTVANDTVPANSRAVVNPIWPRYDVARKIVEGIQAISTDLFAVAETNLTTTATASNYELPADCLSILSVTLEDVGPTQQHRAIGTWSLDVKNSDSKVYLRVLPIGLSGWTLRVTYRKAVTVPDPADLTVGWSTTGLPDSASDIPGLYAKAQLILSPEAARTQQASVEQGERSRALQGWSASASSRRYLEMYAQRLSDERRKLDVRFPVRPHRELVG